MTRFRLIAIVLAWVLTETVALGLHPLLLGHSFSVASLTKARRAILQAPVLFVEPSMRSEAFLRTDALHPYLGFTGDPEVDAGFSNLGLWGRLGWPPPRRDPDRLLVGITGGSFAGELYEFGADQLRDGLARVSSSGDRKIEIVNLSHGGWKQPQQLLALSYLLALGGELDLLINVDGFNEVALDRSENAERGVFPAYPRGWALRVDDFLDGDLAALLGNVVRRSERQSTLATVFGWPLIRLSPVANLFWALLDRSAATGLLEARQQLSTRRSEEDRFRQTGPALAAGGAERMEILVQVWQNASATLARLSAAHGIRYYHFLQPNQYDEGSKPFGDAERRLALREDHPYRPGAREGYPQLRTAGALLTEQGVPFFDLSRLFADTSEPLYADDCCHLTAVGYHRFVDAVVESISTAPHEPPSP